MAARTRITIIRRMTTNRSLPGTVRDLITTPRTWLAAGAALCLATVTILAPIPAPFDRIIAFWLGGALVAGLS